MKKQLLFLSLALIIQTLCIAQTFDPTWASRFQAVLDSTATGSNTRGVSVSVYVPGQGVWTGVHGISSPGVSITADMRFGLASNTKLFVATVMMRLQEQGILSLNDHLYQWLPTYPNIDSTTTIRQLLSHQSGIYDFINDDFYAWKDSVWADTTRFWTPQDILPMVGPPHFAPGHGCSYSNTNFLLARMIIEAATGNTWVQNLHTYILDPLNMDSTFVGAFESPNGPVAHEWANNNTLEIVNSPMTSLYSMFSGAGAMFSTSTEMVQWYRNLFQGNVLSDSSFQELINIEPTSLVGLGIMAYFDNIIYYHTGNSTYGYQSITMYEPQTKSVVSILTNGGVNSMLNEYIYPMLNVLHDDCPKQQNDAGILSIVNPKQNSCNASIIPSVYLKNFGSIVLTSATINYQVDAGTPTTFSWTGSLSTNDSVLVTLPAVTATDGEHTFTGYTSLPNGNVEGYFYNDTARSKFIINLTPTISLMNEGFEGTDFPPAGWIENSVSIFQWGRTSLASHTGSYSLVRSNISDPDKIGSIYDLDMPMVNLLGLINPTLLFTHAYSYRSGFSDYLRVLISTDCGVTWQTLFNKGGFFLRTTPTTYNPFYPANSSQWKNDTISLAAYSGEVLLRFSCLNYYGNNLYIDDVQIVGLFGINEMAYTNTDINVYPNPATNHITIEGVPVKAQLQIADITGKIIYKTTTNAIQNIEVNTSNFAAGVYLVQVQTADFISTQKVIVAK